MLISRRARSQQGARASALCHLKPQHRLQRVRARGVALHGDQVHASAFRDLEPYHRVQRIQARGVALHGDQARAGGQAAGQARARSLQLPRVLALQRQHQPRAVRLATHLRIAHGLGFWFDFRCEFRLRSGGPRARRLQLPAFLPSSDSTSPAPSAWPLTCGGACAGHLARQADLHCAAIQPRYPER